MIKPAIPPKNLMFMGESTEKFEDINTYLNQIRMIMTSSTLLYFTSFVLGSPARRPYRFEFELNDHCRYSSKEDPLHAIGYDEGWLRRVLLSHGLVPEIEYGYQDHVFARLATST